MLFHKLFNTFNIELYIALNLMSNNVLHNFFCCYIMCCTIDYTTFYIVFQFSNIK